mmetsp:Transcript_29535/g.42245  ORF Transcript_29535/g.42245 Transcript_29535/m.42245 type:complete len:82 (-) Transcript_29535:1478-1723(-)
MMAATAARRITLSPRALVRTAGAKRRMGHDAHGEGHHPHNVFEPPYSPVFLGGMALLIVGGGSGAMIFGFAHQQYKQGYWK